jgi:hypothetical protein
MVLLGLSRVGLFAAHVRPRRSALALRPDNQHLSAGLPQQPTLLDAVGTAEKCQLQTSPEAKRMRRAMATNVGSYRCARNALGARPASTSSARLMPP